MAQLNARLANVKVKDLSAHFVKAEELWHSAMKGIELECVEIEALDLHLLGGELHCGVKQCPSLF